MIGILGGSVAGSSRYEYALLPKIGSLKSEGFSSELSNFVGFERKTKFFGDFGELRFGLSFLHSLRPIEVGCYCFRGNSKDCESGLSRMVYTNGDGDKIGDRVSISLGGPSELKSNADDPSSGSNADTGPSHPLMATVGKSTNIVWQECSVGKLERQMLLKQKGCVIWITGLSGSGEVAKLFAEAGVICIASLISPYRRDREACRALLPDSNFIEVFMNIPLEVCEARDAKGLYKLARAGKIKGFTGVDDPYETPLSCEIMIVHKDGVCSTPHAMAEQVISYLEEKGFLQE